MNELKLKQIEQNTTHFLVEVNWQFNFNVQFIEERYSTDVPNNKGTIEIVVEEDNGATSFLNHSFSLSYNGLTENATFDVYILKSEGNGNEVQTHQELGINIAKPYLHNKPIFSK